MPRVFVSTVPFSEKDSTPLQLLQNSGIECVINPLGRKLREEELAELVTDFDALIAGTERISEQVFNRAPSLKLISRVGIGLDNVNLIEAAKRGIQVTHTPDAPAPAVAELTIGLMLCTLRHIHAANDTMHRGEWHRYFGRRLGKTTIGIIGLGRIGQKVMRHIEAFESPRILVNDIHEPKASTLGSRTQLAEKETIYRESDIITLHIPLTRNTKNLISYPQLKMMRKDAILVNTARGGIVNEQDLALVLKEGHLAGAAIDVFEQEPYSGELSKIENCLLTSHMGSMSVDCRTRMEIEATEEVVRFFASQPLRHPVPKEEFENQKEGR